MSNNFYYVAEGGRVEARVSGCPVYKEREKADQAKPAAERRHNPDMNAKKRNACGKNPATAGARPEKLPFGACGKAEGK